ncbi:Hypothetical protein AJAP_28055 [Amycolatopsis japonica]|uniref:Uncharacterized protein n=1 Tax=Amycolatopsis japonica TaxID=208439 RepID=A0A075V6A3_9PSEU|nr:hypothetical protein [Amycolatopsis japonica]AIG78450.1 Hypothetical protein AJAP_28055 [Amycolatopsis japonica]
MGKRIGAFVTAFVLLLTAVAGARFGSYEIYGNAAGETWIEWQSWAQLPGDDNGDGFVDEDETGWNCATMGNRICGKAW